MNFDRFLTSALFAGVLTGVAAAQGSDSCGSAQPISGDGNYNFVLLTATTDGTGDGVCDFFGQDNIENDVWFAWTATTTGTTDISICGLTSLDTKMAVYSGTSCPTGSPIVCNDDTCDLQSEVSFAMTSGNTYLVRVGVYPGTTLGAGQMAITQNGGSGGSGTGADSCSNADPLGGFGSFAFDTTSASTDGSASSSCDFFGQSDIENDVWFAWTASTTSTAQVSTCTGTSFDTKLAVYGGTSCPTGSPLACNDDTCGLQSEVNFSATAGSTYLLRVGNFPGAASGTGTLTISDGGTGGSGCSNATGPDVIVGDLSGITNWGQSGGIAGYSIGTDSCNFGDQPLNWFASTNQHPVIGQNMYRLENGRIEQIGQGWLKHGFAALNLDLCCTCIDPGSQQQLGVGCSDPYGSSLNGGQGGLGPRSEVNPYTGAFTYPFSTQGQTGNQPYKRVAVAVSDLDPNLHLAAMYFGEGHYIAPDDSAAGNGYNNVSYRQINVGSLAGNGAYNLGLTGATQREAPAIQAWQDVIPTVQLENVQAANDGMFIVGSHCTDNGNGTWRYEYAVYNMNSDRCGQAFSVPLGNNVVVSGIGFRDVDSHSGEPYSTTDWTGSDNGSSVSWSTQTFAQNSNANAVRWGTLYNFWFDADAPSVATSGTVTLFKPGTPSDLAVNLCAPGDGAGGGPNTGTAFCFGDGTGSSCPCNNFGANGQGCQNSTSSGVRMTASGSASVTGDTVVFDVSNGVSNQPGLFFQGDVAVNNGNGLAFGDGLRCAGGNVLRLEVAFTDGNGDASSSVLVSNSGSVASGQTRQYQYWYRDPMFSPCLSGFNLSNGLEITWGL